MADGPASGTMYPIVRYRDAKAAIEWLERAFGFERRAIYEGDDGRVQHGALRLGAGVIMIATAPPGDLSMRGASPNSDNQGIYVYIEDVEPHYQRAKVAGAEIERELRDTEYGSKEYSARDIDGYAWHFGTYRPGA